MFPGTIGNKSQQCRLYNYSLRETSSRGVFTGTLRGPGGEADSQSSRRLLLSEKADTSSVKKAKDHPKTQRSLFGVHIQKNTKQDLEEISVPMFIAALVTTVKS